MEEIALTYLGRLDSKIYFFRAQRVMLDSDLAEIYGVSTTRLNEQFKRNRKRFPSDFAFQLDPQEFRHLISQTAISSSHGGRRQLPWVFTEHGAIMLASVLNSDIALEASVRVVRAFVQAIKDLFDAIRQMLEPQTEQTRREIGFHVKEQARRYRTRMDI